MAKAQRMIDAVREAGAVAHHPQYEDHLRKGVDPDGGHFTIDFMEAEDASAPFGRRIVMVDAGVGHLRNPPFGAHPVSFGGDKDPEGVAFGLGDVRTFDEVLAIARRAERAPEP